MSDLAFFPASSSTITTSVFVDNGPIAKPPLTLASGVNATLVDPVTIRVPGTPFGPSVVGKYLTLSGTTLNAGTYFIIALVSGSTLKLEASFNLQDPASGSITWQAFDPRDGQIADHPADVLVTVNRIPVTPMAVYGLRGQIVLPSAPDHGDQVLVNYSWIENPTVEFAKLNDPAFRLNSWDRDVGYIEDPGRHKYRYNNVFLVPSEHVANDIQATLPQPLERGLKYRAYERAYSALLNDPNTLLFNVPTHKIAYPPLQRPLVSTFINYQTVDLPENDPNPWTRNGTGTATIVNDELVVAALPGNPIFWTRPIDLTFPHVFASSWRVVINADPVTEGVFTGVACGFSDSEKACVVGFLDNGGTHLIGILNTGTGGDLSPLSAWTTVPFDWSTVHSYRLYEDPTGNISLFIDGAVVATLVFPESSLPFLSELNEPFNQLQGIFFGSLSRLVNTTSTWDFVRYQILPINPQQIAPSIYVSYQADGLPENALLPWTPVGAHGTETNPQNGLLILDSTSATDQATETLAGLIDGDFRGFIRLEPLLSASSSIALDFNVQLLTWTHGISPNAVMVAVDDSNLLMQLAFFPDVGSPLFSYGGRSTPDQFEPYVWTKLGGQTAAMYGQYLRITDASTTDGLLYYIDDTATASASERVVSSSNDYILEFRCQVVSHTPDPAGFAGINGEVYDSLRDLGVLLQDVSGTKYICLHSEGNVVSQFAFNWDDGNFHTYRIVKHTSGNLVTLFVDTALIGTTDYSSFAAPSPPSSIGVVSFGSTTPASSMSLSVVNWAYCNCWRVNPTAHHYLGLWKGTDPNALTGYHLPLKTSGPDGYINNNSLFDGSANFVAAGVVPGDVIIIDVGPNKGVYSIVSVTQNLLSVQIVSHPQAFSASSAMLAGSSVSGTAGKTDQATATLGGSSSSASTATLVPAGGAHLVQADALFDASASLSATASPGPHPTRSALTGAASLSANASVSTGVTLPTAFPVQPSIVGYRIPFDTDWTMPHRYRLVRDPGGGVSIFLDTVAAPIISVGYNNIDLPPSVSGLPNGMAGGLPSITWGAFDPTNLSETGWQYVQYGITRAQTELQIVPPHQVLNQRNVMASYERHLTNIPHTLTDFWSESEGIPPQTSPDLLANPALKAFTELNEGTPLVPSTQDYDVSRPTPKLVFVVGFNNPQDLLNSPSFLMNSAEQRIELIVPNNILYNSLTVIEDRTGVPNLIAPFTDHTTPFSLGSFDFQGVSCLTYEGDVLPELDPTAVTPWTFQADEPTHVTRSVAGGILTFGTDSTGTRAIYRNSTPLPDAPSLHTQVKFKLKLLNDASFGLGDTQVRFGLSAPRLTASLAFVTTPLGQRYVLIMDQRTQRVVGGLAFDFLDGQFHVYRIVRNPDAALVQVFIDS